jgi:geranylgeranyl pyrophosphate synthase
VIQFILQSRGIEYAKQKMNEYQQKALDILNRIVTTFIRRIDAVDKVYH